MQRPESMETSTIYLHNYGIEKSTCFKMGRIATPLTLNYMYTHHGLHDHVHVHALTSQFLHHFLLPLVVGGLGNGCEVDAVLGR